MRAASNSPHLESPKAAYVYERNASKPPAAEGICQDARRLRNMRAVPALHGAMKGHEGRGARLEKVFVQLCVTIVRGNTPSPSDHKEAKAKPSSPTFDLGIMRAAQHRLSRTVLAQKRRRYDILSFFDASTCFGPSVSKLTTSVGDRNVACTRPPLGAVARSPGGSPSGSRVVPAVARQPRRLPEATSL